MRALAILLLITMSATASAQQIMRWRGPGGTWNYGATPPAGVAAEPYTPGGISRQPPPPTAEEAAQRAEQERAAREWMSERNAQDRSRRAADLRARLAENEAERERNTRCLALARAQAEARDSGAATDLGRQYRMQCQ